MRRIGAVQQQTRMAPRSVVLRIIGGRWRGRLIRAARGAALRPSGGRVRESLFNCLGQRLDGLSCLDLFAGSGVLGLEAASRGAARVVLVEKNAAVAANVRRHADELNAPVEIVATTAAKFLAQTQESFDVVFLDPPFALCRSDSDWAELLAAVADHLRRDGRVYCESGAAFALPQGWAACQQKRTGNVHWQILQRGER